MQPKSAGFPRISAACNTAYSFSLPCGSCSVKSVAFAIWKSDLCVLSLIRINIDPEPVQTSPTFWQEGGIEYIWFSVCKSRPQAQSSDAGEISPVVCFPLDSSAASCHYSLFKPYNKAPGVQRASRLVTRKTEDHVCCLVYPEFMPNLTAHVEPLSTLPL